MHTIQTGEMGGPLLLDADLARLRDHYDRDRVTLPEGPGLGLSPDEAIIARRAGGRYRLDG